MENPNTKTLVTAADSNSVSNFRNIFAVVIVILAIVLIAIIAIIYYFGNSADAPERIFSAILPLVATWIGTVIAFYFGSENFEAASNRYEKIFSKLSPEILDDVSVRQIMISRKTMVSLSFQAAQQMTVNELIDFLNTIDKSRLPILEDGKAKFIIHKSTFLNAQNRADRAEVSWAVFAEENAAMIGSYIEVLKDETLESIRQKMNEKKNVQDVFVVDDQKKVIGWLTDTLIMRYIRV